MGPDSSTFLETREKSAFVLKVGQMGGAVHGLKEMTEGPEGPRVCVTSTTGIEVGRGGTKILASAGNLIKKLVSYCVCACGYAQLSCDTSQSVPR